MKPALVLGALLALVASAFAQDWWSAPADLGGVALQSGPAAAANGHNPIDVFYRGPNDHLWTSWWDGGPWWSAPADLGGTNLTSEPTAIANAAHKLDVFYRGPNNHLWQSWWPAKPGSPWWSGAADLGGVAMSSAPAAVGHGRHTIDVFYRGPNNHLWTSWWPDKPGSPWWSAPADLGGVALGSAPTVVAGAQHTLDVFYVGPNGHLWTSWWPDKPGSQWWSGAADLGGGALTSAPVAVANASHTIDVFYRGANNHLWTSFWPDKPGSPWWSGAADLGGVELTSGPGAVGAAHGKIDVFYRGPNNDLWTSWYPDRPFVDVQTGKAAPAPAPYDLLTQDFDPDNGLPLNPRFGSQTFAANPREPDPSMCGNGHPWEKPCTSQSTYVDNNWGLCPSGSLGGHANWNLALYEGRVYWADHSYYLQDDDYSFAFYRDDHAGMTAVDVAKREYLHSEFSSDQTINHFHTSYWDTLHQAVDKDGGVGGFSHGPWPNVTPLFDGKDAIIMGLFGLDCAHSCGAELHPVYAFAIHLKDDPDDDTWSIFVRNWGNEGYCSSGEERIAPNDPFTFTFRFKRPGATAVTAIPAAETDGEGKTGTVFYGESDKNAQGISWGGPFLVKGEGATVTFNLPPSSQGPMVNGMLHLKWTVAPTAKPFRKETFRAQAPLAYKPPPAAELHEEAEGKIGEKIAALPPAKRKAIEKAAAITPVRPRKVVKLPSAIAAPVPPRPPATHVEVTAVPDATRAQRQKQITTVLRKTLPPN